MSSISKSMNQAAPGAAYADIRPEPNDADGKRWHRLAATIFFGGTRERRVNASRGKRRQALDNRMLRELMVGAQAGDKASYAELLAACALLVRRAARRVGVRDDLIEDVVRETLITVHDARQTYDPSRSFSAWLDTIAQRRAIEALARSGRNARQNILASLD